MVNEAGHAYRRRPEECVVCSSEFERVVLGHA
jgi:hypothetical protein